VTLVPHSSEPGCRRRGVARGRSRWRRWRGRV